jgi:hypothetical protein
LVRVALVVAESVAWINQPIAPVVAPPVSETITQAQLEHLGSHTTRTKKGKSKQ